MRTIAVFFNFPSPKHSGVDKKKKITFVEGIFSVIKVA